jgi:hypothetical protein
MPFTIRGQDRAEVEEVAQRLTDRLGREAVHHTLISEDGPGWWRAVVTLKFRHHFDNRDLSHAQRARNFAVKVV